MDDVVALMLPTDGLECLALDGRFSFAERTFASNARR